MLAVDFIIGYGKGAIEPGIAPLVQAVADAGYETFSSCEGHPNRESDFSRFPLVSFYADEARARAVHVALVNIRDKLYCIWILRAAFLLHRDRDEWVLGWTLENTGLVAEANTREEFERLTVEVGRDHDLPIIIEIFRKIQGALKAE